MGEVLFVWESEIRDGFRVWTKASWKACFERMAMEQTNKCGGKGKGGKGKGKGK